MCLSELSGARAPPAFDVDNQRGGLLPVPRMVMTRIRMAHPGLALAVVVAGALCQVAPARALAQLGQPEGATAVRPAIMAGGEHSCALLPAGTVECWGRNYF